MNIHYLAPTLILVVITIIITYYLTSINVYFLLTPVIISLIGFFYFEAKLFGWDKE